MFCQLRGGRKGKGNKGGKKNGLLVVVIKYMDGSLERVFVYGGGSLFRGWMVLGDRSGFLEPKIRASD